jgi:plastocyanin
MEVRMRPRIAGAIVLVALLVLGGCGDGDDEVGTSESSDDTVSADSANDQGTEDVVDGGDSPSVSMSLDNKAFDPTFIRAAPGASLTIEVENPGMADHTFTIDGTGIDETFDPGDVGKIEVDVPDDGELVFYCRFHQRSGMIGAVLVGDAQPQAGSEPDSGSTTAPPTTDEPAEEDGGSYGY